MEGKLNQIYLGLGTNLGDKQENIKQALKSISTECGRILKISSYYFSKPQGFISNNEFINLVIKIESTKLPTELLFEIQKIERDLGRLAKSNGEYQDRIIDIDILHYNNDFINDVGLIIPHPLIFERDFVKLPLLEIIDESYLVDLYSNK